ncbi:Glycerol-3-phosphate phosphatase [Halotydeus destructor]|nr:Glycerol-3-phosphate phosphatase [Halotydeus destructor]
MGVGHDVGPVESLDNIAPSVHLTEGTIGAVVVGLDSRDNLIKLVKACTYASKVPDHLFIATDLDETVPIGRADLVVPGTGCFASFIRTAIGRSPVSVGKPSSIYWDGIVASKPGMSAQRSMMVGDNLNTDIKFGNSNGLKYSVLVGTGISNLESVGDLIASGNDDDKLKVPTHYIESLSHLLGISVTHSKPRQYFRPFYGCDENVTNDMAKTIRQNMTEPIRLNSKEVVNSVLDNVDHVLFDCDGVLYLSDSVIDGTPEVVKRLRSMGKKIVFATNNSSKSRQSVLSKLNRLGFEATIEEVVGSSYLVAVYLKHVCKFEGRVYIFGNEGIKEELDAIGIDNVGVGHDGSLVESVDDIVPSINLTEGTIGAVVIGFDSRVNLIKLVKACTYASRVPDNLFIATNRDETFPTGRPDLLVPGTGCFVNFIQTALGRSPVSMGKPGSIYWEGIVASNPGISAQRSLMVGDRLNTDIKFGNSNGLKHSVLVGTGINNLTDVRALMASGSDDDKLMVPTHYIDNLSHLLEYL